MAEAQRPPSAAVLAVAEEIADGRAVDWKERTAVVGVERETRFLERLRAVEAVVLAFRRATGAQAPAGAFSDDATEPPPSELFTWGPLSVRARLGEGSFGEVFRAYDRALDREVALKLRRPSHRGEQQSGRRFLGEARRLARVRHPHVVTVHGAEVHHGRIGLWTDLVEGATLGELVEERGPMGAAEAALVGVELCQALAAVHRAGLVHGDVKPANVMRERGGRIVLMDFGAGARLDARTGLGSAVAGTPAVMAPEVRERLEVSPRADLYSLGALLYFLVAGAYPVEPEPAGGEVRSVPLRDRRPDLPAAFVGVVERALASESGARFASAGEMERALRATASTGESAGGQQAPAVGRRSGIAAAAAASIVALLIAAGWWWLAARDARAPRVVSQNVVSSSPGNHGEPAFSADGELIAFVGDSSGTPQVWVQSADGGQPVQVTHGEVAASSPSWTAGGEIVYAREGEGIWAIAALGGEPRRLAADGARPHAARDGGTFVFERGQELWLGELSGGGEPRRIEAVPERVMSWVPASPALSPDGGRVAYFAQEVGPLGDLWVVDLGSAERWRLTHDLAQGGDPAWSADGGHVVFWSLRGGSRNLWVVPAEGGEPAPLTAGAGEDGDPAVSPNGRSVLFANTRTRWALTVLDPSSGAERSLLERRHPFHFPTPSPTDDRIAYFQEVRGDAHVFTIRPDGNGLQQVTRGSSQLNAHPSWSPDGRWLYYYRIHPQPGLRRIPSAGGASEEVVPGWHVDLQPEARLDPSGRRLAYLDHDASDGTTKLRDLATGRERPLAHPHLHSISWLPGGEALIGWQHGDTIAVCPVSGAACRPLTSGKRPRLAPGGRHVYFQRQAEGVGAWQVWRRALDGGEEEQMATVGPMARISTEVAVLVGGELVFSRLGEERREVFRLDLATPLR